MKARVYLNINVVEAAERRIVNTFNNNKYVYMSVSGGKDSIVMTDIVKKTMMKHNIDFSRITLNFIDEEAIYPDVEKAMMKMRSEWLALGAKFNWFCLQVKHFNCCNSLANDESFICWEKSKKDVWIRPMPKFAIKSHSMLKPGMTYQRFFDIANKGVPTFIGLRIAESYMRTRALAITKEFNDKVYPIYDFTDKDIWLYIYNNNLEFPMTYIYLYKTGVGKRGMRLSQFFSVDTIRSLPNVALFYPKLYDAVLRREPNVDLVSHYFNTRMFRSSKQDKNHKVKKDYKNEFYKYMSNPKTYELAGYTQVKYILRLFGDVEYSQNIYKELLEILIAGDPKQRSTRALMMQTQLERSCINERQKDNGTKKSRFT